MAEAYGDEQLPFTPPPYYVHKRDLPRSRGRLGPAPEQQAETAGSRAGLSLLRRISTRGASGESEGRVIRPQKKRQKPGLSINTNVLTNTRAPREITTRQPTIRQAATAPSFQAPPNATSNLPPQYTEQAQSHFSAATNSPSRFPSTYLSTARSSAQRSSSQPQDLFFAPPPRPSSSLYSRSARNSIMNRDSLRKFASKNAKVRESNATAFEEDFEAPRRQRTLSNDTTFEEDTVDTAVAPVTANTITPHRSRGWWNVVTTPFAKTPTNVKEITTSEGPFSHGPHNEVEYPPVPVPPIPGHYRTHASSSTSVSSAVFSPSEQDIPIALGGELMIAVPSPAQGQVTSPDVLANGSASSTSESTSTLDRMPFCDDGKSPASRIEEFSPAGLVSGEGVVACSRVEVKPAATNVQQQTRNSIVPERGQTRDSARSSMRAAVSRTVRFITPRSSIYPPPPGQYTASREPFNPPPTPYYRRDSCISYEEMDYEDVKSLPPKKKKKASSCFSCCFGKKSKQKDDKKEKKKMTRRKKCCLCCFCVVVILLILLALIIVLAVMLSRKKGASFSNQTTWVNTTAFPPLITGALSVARPNLVSSQSGCVNPSTAWSCAVPKEQQQALAPNAPNQPNFFFNIRFDNSSGLIKRSSTGSAAHALHVLRARAATPSPPTPNLDEQKFLGNTTDKNASPFEGENTPFYISFNDPGSVSASTPTKVKRQSKPSQSANEIPNIATNIPLPSLNPDNTPGPASLLPFPKEQPLRLYNRGRNDEHYGFYSYFEKSIFLRSNAVKNLTGDIVNSDLDGGATQAGANARCTWQDTRFRVQIWTKRSSGQLLSKASSGSKINGVEIKRPGSFPYPITISLDRHGGGLSTKMLYCYTLDEKGRVNADQRSFLGEDRTFNGTIVNPSTGPFSTTIPKVSIAEGGPGGIDGGSGGCGCSWQNWS